MRRAVVIAVLTAAVLTSRIDGVLASALAPLKEAVEPGTEPVTEPVQDLVRQAPSTVAGPSTEQVGGTAAQGFISYPAPESFADAHNAGEPSIGVDKPGRNLLLMNATVARASFDDTASPPTVTWDDASPAGEPPVNLDPLLYTDRATYRTFLAQLEGEVAYGAITDDGGDTWTPTQPPTAAPSFDHQSIGAGPYPAGSAPLAGYPNAAYYCSQLGIQVNTAGNGFNSVSECARSDTGGQTWNPPVPINLFQCGGLHGKVVVDPSGSVYVPNRSCPDAAGTRRQGVFVSPDAGVSWAPTVVPGTTESQGDPAIAFDAAGTGYFMGNSGGHPVVTTTTDSGATWSKPVDLGTSFGLQNNEFSMAVAGDAGRAAVAFLGTPTSGDDQASTFEGVWHLYEAFTTDGGATWSTVDVTPSDPVQRGCIWMGGGSNPCRNLLDFDSITADATGRVAIGYADGCTGACAAPGGVPTQSRDALGTIARQVTGPRLLAAFDPALGSEPLYVEAGGPYSTSAGAPVTLMAHAFGGFGTYSYRWDLDGDGAYNDANGSSATFTSDAVGDHTVGLEVVDRPGPGHHRQAVTDTAVVTVIAPAQPLTESQRWAFDGAGGACDTQGWTTYTVAADAGGDEPTVQSEKWHLVANQAASAPCAWSHGIDGADTYPSLQYTLMESPCVDLTTVAAARLDFAYAGELETDPTTGTQYDTMTVGYEPCGTQDSQVLATFGGKAGDLDASPAVYQTGSVDLSALHGPVQLVFTIHSDDSGETRGYQVDDVRVLTG